MSERCFVVTALGGVCGECNSDADCPDGGCTIPNPLADPPVGSTCNDGSAGTGCETDEVCQDGLVCGTLVEIPGIFALQTCGECLTDADCADGQLCSPTVDIGMFNGQRTCSDPGTSPNGELCDLDGSGNEACESGLCATVDIEGIVQVGVCGDCGVDADCMGADEVCLPADIDIDSGEVIPPTCGVPR